MRKLCLILLGFLLLLIQPCQSAYASSLHSPYAPRPDVLIDVGHGGVDGGAGAGTALEKHINLQISLKLYQSLRRFGYHTALNRTKDWAPSEDNRWARTRSRHMRDLAQRSLVNMKLRPKVMISLHCNAATSEHKRGAIVLYRLTPMNHTLAHLLQFALNEYYGLKGVPYIRRNLYLLNSSRHPAALIELGFITSPQDRRLLQNPASQQALADQLAGAIMEYLTLFHLESTVGTK